MKKSITVIALAVMMLFAFTACEPSSMTIKQESDTPSSAVMATLADPDYYAGTDLTANGKVVKATVTKEDGSTVEVMGTLKLTNNKVVAGENIATFAYGPVVDGKQTTVNAIINGIGVKAVQLDTSKVTTSYKQTEYDALDVESNGAEVLAKGAVVTYVWEDDTTAAAIDGVKTSFSIKDKIQYGCQFS